MSPLEKAWMKKRFDELERQNAVIIRMLHGGNLIPELEAQVRRAAKLARHIDEKVPDSNVPPTKENQ